SGDHEGIALVAVRRESDRPAGLRLDRGDAGGHRGSGDLSARPARLAARSGEGAPEWGGGSTPHFQVDRVRTTGWKSSNKLVGWTFTHLFHPIALGVGSWTLGVDLFGLQILQQRRLGGRIERRAVEVTGVAVAAIPGVEAHSLTLGIRAARHEPDVGPVVDIVRTIELGWPLRRVEQGTQRRHRTVVKVRRTQPEAVERHVRVAAGLAEVRELPGFAFADGVHPLGEPRSE